MLDIVKSFVLRELEGVCSAHDIHHIERVYLLSRRINQEEKLGDDIVIMFSSWLHEMLDDKFFKEDISNQREKVLSFLRECEISSDKLEDIMYILENIGYGKSLSGKKINKTVEFQIVEDADRLESLGAIAVARTFAYGGKNGRPIHNPNMTANENLTPENYGKSTTSINHFYEKLLKLKDSMNTQTGKEIAYGRHLFLEQFLNQFLDEWEGVS